MQNLQNQLRATFRVLDTSGLRRIHLSGVRKAFPEVAKADFDAAVLALHAEGLIALYPLDAPWEREARDDASAINVGGTRYHIAYVNRSPEVAA